MPIANEETLCSGATATFAPWQTKLSQRVSAKTQSQEKCVCAHAKPEETKSLSEESGVVTSCIRSCA
jgi:hypothetical protein